VVEGGPDGLVMATHATLPLDLWKIGKRGGAEDTEMELEVEELQYVPFCFSLPPSLPPSFLSTALISF